MEFLREKFLKTDSFLSITKLLKKKEIKEEGKNILKDFLLEDKIKVEIFLSSFLFYLYPDDFKNEQLYQLSKKIIFQEGDEVNSIVEFQYLFREWKGESLEKLKEELFQQYHSLTVEILNTEEKELKEELKRIQDSLLKSAEMIGFKKKILDYIPIIYDSRELEEQYNNAYFNLLEEEIKNKNFKQLENILDFLVRFFSIFFPREEIEENIDIEFIKQQFLNDILDPNPIFLYIYELFLKIQSPQRDVSIEKELSFIEHIRQIFDLIKYFIIDLENLKK